MRIRLLLTIAALTAAFVATGAVPQASLATTCKAPTGDFNIQPWNSSDGGWALVNQQLNFNNYDDSNNGVSVAWDFPGAPDGDTTSSSTHRTYSTPGYYTATLTVTNACGTITKRMVFAVKDPTLPNGGLPIVPPPTGGCTTATGDTATTPCSIVDDGDGDNDGIVIVTCPTPTSCSNGFGGSATGGGASATGTGTGAGGAVLGASASRSCIVPKLKGLTLKRAKRKAAKAGCRIAKPKYRHIKHRRKNRIAKQSRKVGKHLAYGTKIRVVIAR